MQRGGPRYIQSVVDTPKPDCKYFEKFRLGAAKECSGLSLCKNVTINCEAFKNKNTFWSYNIASHYMKDHPS